MNHDPRQPSTSTYSEVCESEKREQASSEQDAAYAEGRSDEAAERDRGMSASRLIDLWCELHKRPMEWAAAVEVVAVVHGLAKEERDRLLNIGKETE